MSCWQLSVFHRVSVNLMFCLKMVFSNVVVDVNSFYRSFAYMHTKVSASFTNVIDMAVAAFDLVYCFLSGLRFVFVLDVNSCHLTPSDWLLFHPPMIDVPPLPTSKTRPQISVNCSIICNILFAALLTSSVQYGKFLPNLVNSTCSWLWIAYALVLANQKWRNILKLNSSPIDKLGRWCLQSWWSRAVL